MVTKFIGDILRKKEGSVSSEGEKSTEDVPDELPPLVEEELQEEEEKPQEEKPPKETKGSSKESTVIKDFREMEETIKEAVKEETTKEVSEDEPEEKPKEESVSNKEEEGVGNISVESSPLAEEELQEEEEKKEEKPHEEKTEEKPQEKEKSIEEEKGFFSELFSLTTTQGISDKILRQDLFRRMKDFWYFHPQQKGRFGNKKKLEQEIIDELSQLKRLEERWIAQKNFLEEDKRILLEKERDIRTKTYKLQRMLNQLKIYEHVPPEKSFKLSNGISVKSLYELINLLEIIDDTTFNHHVTNEKNDFSDWIRNVLKNNYLADKLRAVQSRNDMIEILEGFYHM